MNLTPREREKMMVSLAAMIARNRLARGVRLNHPEAVALITDFENVRVVRLGSRHQPDAGVWIW